MRTRLLILMLAVPAAVLPQERSALPLPASPGVTLPLDEYNRLVELARNPAKKPEKPPFPYTIKRADLRLQVAGESASGKMQLEGEIFSKGATKVPLISGMTVLDAQQKGRELPLRQEGSTHVAFLTGPAEFAITLDTGFPLTIDAGRASFKLPAPAAGTVRLTLAIPGDHTKVNISPGLITGRTSTNGQTTVEATLVPGQPATVWWATRENAAPAVPREVRFLSDVKTLFSVSETQLGIVALADITIVQGEPPQFEIEVPAGYEVTGSGGASLESAEVQSGVLILKVNGASQRSHQFLVSMEKPIDAPKADVPFLSFKGAQRETGEALVESEGTMELTAAERGSLKRMDLKETSPYLRSLAHNPLQAAFRYHRQPAESLGLALEWVRFPDRSLLAAVAQRAIVTTLVTSEGRSLTEVRLVLRNQAQPFLKVALPAGASILSADVAGEKVKPVLGADGDRVPLLRTGFRPTGPYTVSFVFMHSGAPFAKKGGSELGLPRMDIPIGLLQWEVFLPERYKVKDFGGDAISTNLLPPLAEGAEEAAIDVKDAEAWPLAGSVNLESLRPGQLGGVIFDQAGGVIPGAQVTVVNEAAGTTARAVADSSGRWIVSNLPSGTVTIDAIAAGFNRTTQKARYDASRPARFSLTLRIGTAEERVEVTSEPETLSTRQLAKLTPGLAQNAASSNVGNLQRRVAGVLPIAVDVPHAGNSYRFMRPLVLDEETKVTFSYRTK